MLNVIVTTLQDMDHDRNGVVTVAGELNALLEAEGHRVTVLTPANGIAPANRLAQRICYRLRKAARGNGIPLLYYLSLRITTRSLSSRAASLPFHPDLVIAHDALTAGAALRGAGGNVPVLLICHFGTAPWLEFANAALLPEGTAGYRLLQRWMRQVMADPRITLVAVSERNASLLRSLLPGIPPERIHVAYTGGPLPDLPEKQPPRDPTAPPTIINVGRFDPWKNQRILPDVAAEMVKRRVACRFVLVGPDVDGEQEQVRQRCDDLGVGGMFTFTGPLSREEVFLAMRDADLYLHTSRMESFGLTLVEAMATGLPVMALEYDTLSEVLPTTPEARIPSDAAAPEIAASVAALLGDRLRLADIRRRQGSVYRQRFSPEAFRKTYLGIIEEATRTG